MRDAWEKILAALSPPSAKSERSTTKDFHFFQPNPILHHFILGKKAPGQGRPVIPPYKRSVGSSAPCSSRAGAADSSEMVGCCEVALSRPESVISPARITRLAFFCDSLLRHYLISPRPLSRHGQHHPQPSALCRRRWGLNHQLIDKQER